MQAQPAPTFVFADLVGYTALTEQRGDEAAARLAREFRRTMCGLSRDHGAWQVKSMGDGVMIWAPDAGQAVALAARLADEAEPNEALISAATRDAARDGSTLGRMERRQLALRGVERPVSAWRLT